MTLWTYRFAPEIDGRRYDVRLRAGLSAATLQASDGHGASADDHLQYSKEPYRIQRVTLPSPGGALHFDVAPRSWYAYGLRVTAADGRVLHESHPDPFAYFPVLQKRLASQAGSNSQVDTARMKKNAPAIATDIALGLVFFITAKLTDLRTAALTAAAIGIALYGVQWLLNRVLDAMKRPRIDLLGGLAMFGIVMLLISAAFSWYFYSERAVQLKSTYLGLLVAAFFAIDAWRGAPYLGKRLSLYIAYNDVDPQRLAYGFALVGAAMASVNALVAFTVSKDLWLYYSLWGDMVLAIGLSMWVIERARRPRPA